MFVASGRQEQLPSWVPDYNLNQGIAPYPLAPSNGRKIIYGAAGHGDESKYTGLHVCQLSDSWTQLKAEGLECGMQPSARQVGYSREVRKPLKPS